VISLLLLLRAPARVSIVVACCSRETAAQSAITADRFVRVESGAYDPIDPNGNITIVWDFQSLDVAGMTPYTVRIRAFL
jgi:hypothetical protein